MYHRVEQEADYNLHVCFRACLCVCVCLCYSHQQWVTSLGPQCSRWCRVSTSSSRLWCWYQSSHLFVSTETTASLITSDCICLLQIGFGLAAGCPRREHIVSARHVFLIKLCLFGRLVRTHANLEQQLNVSCALTWDQCPLLKLWCEWCCRLSGWRKV